MDTSEARYAEMARKMLELNNWVTPMFDYDVPFWGKPPLLFWLQAVSMEVFGVNAFAARLPAWLFHVASCFFIVQLARRNQTLEEGVLAAIVFSGCLLGFVSAGAVITDPFLGFAIVLAFFGFWCGISEDHRWFARLGYIGLGLGLLAKGPSVLVLFGVPALIWIALHNKWMQFLRLPWLSGIALMCLVALPWYLLAERATPGFLDYFLIGEHWNRYVESGWSGDRYGDAHSEPIGMIWLYLLVALMPFTFLIPLMYQKRQCSNRYQRTRKDREWVSLLWCWALSTPLFFTFAGNVLGTYVLPALPAWSLLIARVLVDRSAAFVWASLATTMVMTTLIFAAIMEGSLLKLPQNQKGVVELWRSKSSDRPGELYYLYKRRYAAEFYADGKVSTVHNPEDLPDIGPYYVASRERDLAKQSQSLPDTCEMVATLNQTKVFYCS